MAKVYSPDMKQIKKNRLRDKTSLFSLFLLISTLLHLLAGFVLQNHPITPEPPQKFEQTAVALEDRKNWLELDQKPLEKITSPPKDAAHIAEANATVKQETAPKGDDSRDKQRLDKQEQQVAKRKTEPAQKKQSTNQKPSPPPVPPLQADAQGDRRLPKTPEPEDRFKEIPVNLPNLSQLTNLSKETLSRLDQQQQNQRSKDRPEIELKDDEVWLNLRQDDKLISFFRRFSDRIEAVWNYPVEASSQGVEGTLLIKIIVNKKGELIDAFPMESSGSDVLDYEAITAVYRAAPFGELPSDYKHDQLKIFAHFQYSLNRRMIYGNP